MKILTCYVATTEEEKRNVIRATKPIPYVILSDITFTGNIILLSEVDRKRPREVKSRLYQYISFRDYDYVVYQSPTINTHATAIAESLDGKIGLCRTTTLLTDYSSFLTPAERHLPICTYSTDLVFIPTTSTGLLFTDFWNRYMCRLKEHEDLAITLVAMRHFKNQVESINRATANV